MVIDNVSNSFSDALHDYMNHGKRLFDDEMFDWMSLMLEDEDDDDGYDWSKLYPKVQSWSTFRNSLTKCQKNW